MARVAQTPPTSNADVQSHANHAVTESPLGIVPLDGAARTFTDPAAATSSAVRPNPSKDVPVAKHYRVTQTGYYFEAGHRYTIMAGRLITNAMYDIEVLKQQGIALQEVPG